MEKNAEKNVGKNADKPAEHVTQKPASKKRSVSTSQKRNLSIAAVAFVSIAASVTIGYRAAGRVAAPNPNASWHGKIQVVSRAPGSEAAKKGLTLKNAGSSTAGVEGAEIGAGTEIETDARTRARINFDDGTSIAIDRGTRIKIGAVGRTMQLEEGQIIADVAHIEGAAAAKLTTPNGDVAVLGT
ncbi:MAG: FecR domain-containing protein, partial [Polyangiaceae bacterium]